MMPQSTQTIRIIFIIVSQTGKRVCVRLIAATLLKCAQTRVIRKCFFLSFSLHPRPNSKLANASWIIRQIYWQRADYRNEWCMMPFCSIVHVSIYLLASKQKVWRHSIACPLASDRVLVIWYTGYSKRASPHRAERKSQYLHRYSHRVFKDSWPPPPLQKK